MRGLTIVSANGRGPASGLPQAYRQTRQTALTHIVTWTIDPASHALIRLHGRSETCTLDHASGNEPAVPRLARRYLVIRQLDALMVHSGTRLLQGAKLEVLVMGGIARAGRRSSPALPGGWRGIAEGNGCGGERLSGHVEGSSLRDRSHRVRVRRRPRRSALSWRLRM
jgi:hypothetical protein